MIELEMLRKNNELFTNTCLLLMIWKQLYRSIIISKGFSEADANNYINELIKVIHNFEQVIINDVKWLWINIEKVDYSKKLDF